MFSKIRIIDCTTNKGSIQVPNKKKNEVPGPLTSVFSDEALRSSEWTGFLLPSPSQATSSELVTLQIEFPIIKMIKRIPFPKHMNF